MPVTQFSQLLNSGQHAASYTGTTSGTRRYDKRAIFRYVFSPLFFRFRFWPCAVIVTSLCVYTPHFITNRTTHSGVITSYRFARWQPRRRITTSGFAFGDVTLVRRPKSICKPNFGHMYQPRTETTISVLEKQTSAILELSFRFQFRPYHRHRHFILHRSTKFHLNRTTRGGVMMSHRF